MSDLPERTPIPGMKRPVPVEPPTLVGNAEMACPVCGCGATFMIRVRFKECEGEGQDPLQLVKKSLNGYYVARYLGCPACPWASAAVLSPEVPLV